MVSLEIFGLNGKKAVKMESRMFDQLRANKFAKDIIIVVHNSTTRNAQMINQSFIRICGNSDSVLAREIQEKLAPLGLKLQRLALAQVD